MDNSSEGNLMPAEWAWVGYVGQHLMVIPTWSSIFVSEALVVVIAHHFSTYYAVLNQRLHTLFRSFTPKTSRGKMASSLQRPKSESLTPDHRPPQVDSVYHFIDEDFQEQFQQTLCVRESVGDLLDTFNAIFSPIVLASLSMLTIVTVAFFPQILKVGTNSGVITNSVGYLVVAVSGVIRLIVIVVGQACVHNQASITRGVLLHYDSGESSIREPSHDVK
ncbi:hypothetical protein E2C01_083367 [Portunus trituberculatus]|uniref:Uncharacterized protein n=1 Tax=Portunus trituberculatus TaxID=210409 RepID=A0A5B7IX07_PORTR|nr:hypothetical protein [Portunus trituberculatus]